MTDTPLTLSDIATFAAIGSSVFAVVFGVFKFLIDYLSQKFGKGMTPAEQSEQCRFDHKELGGVLAQQNANIARLYEQNLKQQEQNGEQIKALSDANHAAQLRHQIVLNEFQKTHDLLIHIKEKHNEHTK